MNLGVYSLTLLYRMPLKTINQYMNQYQDLIKAEYKVEDPQNNISNKNDVYLCGQPNCHRRYQSYTAFYNHCKKNHTSTIPSNTKLNSFPFYGPSENRGRPKIIASQCKSKQQITLLKNQNSLIQFLGTQFTIKNQKIITIVNHPIQNLRKVDTFSKSFKQLLLKTQEEISSKILAQDRDPIQQVKGCIDPYNFRSIIEQMKVSSMAQILCCLICWMSRFLNVKILCQISDCLSFTSYKFKQAKEEQQVIRMIDQMNELPEGKYLQKKGKALLKQILKYLLVFSKTRDILLSS